MLAAFLFAGGVFGAVPSDAQQEATQQEPCQAVPAPEIYSRVEFAAPTQDVLPFVAESGLIAGVLSEDPVVAELSESELALVDAADVEYTVDEDQAGDSERSHTTEQITHIVFG